MVTTLDFLELPAEVYVGARDAGFLLRAVSIFVATRHADAEDVDLLPVYIYI